MGSISDDLVRGAWKAATGRTNMGNHYKRGATTNDVPSDLDRLHLAAKLRLLAVKNFEEQSVANRIVSTSQVNTTTQATPAPLAQYDPVQIANHPFAHAQIVRYVTNCRHLSQIHSDPHEALCVVTLRHDAGQNSNQCSTANPAFQPRRFDEQRGTIHSVVHGLCDRPDIVESRRDCRSADIDDTNPKPTFADEKCRLFGSRPTAHSQQPISPCIILVWSSRFTW